MRFGLRWHDRHVFGSQKPRRFLDYVVDGASLYERQGFDLVTPLGWGAAEEEERAAQRLLRTEAPDLSDRVAIYVCPEDGDLLCGAITAVIAREGSDIVWREPAYSTCDYLTDAWHHDPLRLDAWPAPVLRFDWAEYLNVVRSRFTDRALG